MQVLQPFDRADPFSWQPITTTKEEAGGACVTIALKTIATMAVVGGGGIIVLGNVTVPTGAIAMTGLTVATVGVELGHFRYS